MYKKIIVSILISSIFITGALSVTADDPELELGEWELLYQREGPGPFGATSYDPDFSVHSVWIQQIPLYNSYRVKYKIYNPCPFCVIYMKDYIYLYDPIAHMEYPWDYIEHEEWDAYGDLGTTGFFTTDWNSAPRRGLMKICIELDCTDIIEESDEMNNLHEEYYDFQYIWG